MSTIQTSESTTKGQDESETHLRRRKVAGHSPKANVSIPSQRAIGLV